MSLTSSFVAELIRAANEIERLTISEVSQLLQRSVVTVRDLREQVGIPGSGTQEDVIIRIVDVARTCEHRSNGERSQALLEAADLMRTLGIVIDSGTRILVTRE
ncbi:DNA-binding protein [Rhizobium leguminosarum]|uniref:DNA-binding protein n=1 Tax=Rhizobium leguminosarum TaxID=384 RepID=UPI000FEC9890|nr:DNA-binding protein [Rhizobium leguminosarum]RWX19245.1 DNA-binding protein [Rhizobium leguminosarum]